MPGIEPIRQAARQLVRELHLLDGRHCIEGFSFSECHLVTELEQLGRATASQLAELLVLEKSTVSRLVNGLLASGMLEATQDTLDRRRRWLSLTADGRDGARRVHRYAQGQVRGALEYVPDDEASALVSGLQRYAQALRYARLGEDVAIRSIRPADNPAVATIIRDVMTEYDAVGEGYSIEDPEVDDMHVAYPAPGAKFWVIEKDGKLLGCGGFAALEGGGGKTCELRKMYFRPELRGLGLDNRLLKMCLAQARQAGYTQCYLETLDAMEGARRLYSRHGFKPLDRPLGRTGHTGCNAWMMQSLEP